MNREYIRNLIVKIASDTTGDDVEVLLRAGKLQIAPRDAIEFVVRLEAAFDCVLGRLRYEPLSVEIDALAAVVLAAVGSQQAACGPD
jgi:hypothetical protein